MPFIVAILSSFALTAVSVPLSGLLARALGVVAHPGRDRWNDRTVPRLGGVAMFIAIVVLAWIEQILPIVWPVIVMASMMFGVGLLDDLRPINAPSKLGLQAVGAVIMLAILPATRIVGIEWLDYLIGFFWLVGLTNAFNLLDNMDGLAAGVAAIAGLGLVILFRLDGSAALMPFALAASALVGAAAGFLLYNFQPASIFMGDCGSHLLGAFLASVTWFCLPHETSGVTEVFIPAVLLLLPIGDTGFVIVTRAIAGRSAFVGGRDHVSHRLVHLGLTVRQAVLLLWAVAGAAAATAIALRGLPAGLGVGFAVLGAAALVLTLVYLAAASSDLHRNSARAILPIDFIASHPAFLLALDVVLLAAAYHFSFVIRFHEPQLDHFLPYFLESLPLVVVLQSLGVWLARNPRRPMSAQPSELVNVAKGALAGVVASVIALLWWRRFQGYSRWVFALDGLLAPTFVIGTRLLLLRIDDMLRPHAQSRRPALVYGAGNAGALALRELLQNRDLALAPVGILDDNPVKHGLEIDGVPVIGGLDQLERLLAAPNRGISVVVIAIKDLSADHVERVTRLCEAHDVDVRRMRFALESIERRDRSTTVVKFPGA